MTPGNVPHICGGILFDLLLEARKPRRKARDKFNGGSDGLTAPAVYAGLINVVTGEDVSNYAGTTLEKCASDYKKCLSSAGEYVPFTSAGTISALDSAYKRKDPALLERTVGFIKTYLNTAKCEWLTRALIEIMQAENSLRDKDIAISGDETRKVHELHSVDAFVFPIFFLSVLHFVMVERPDCESGRATFEEWYSQSSPKAEWKFRKNNLGDSIPAVSLSFDIPNVDKELERERETISRQVTAEKSDHDVIQDQFHKVGVAAATTLAEALDKLDLPSEEQLIKTGQVLADAFGAFEHQTAERIRESKKAENKNSVNNNPSDRKEENATPHIVQQTIVNQYGDHAINIGHIENLKL